jgi:branched-chain amino acid transport system ATP-binding protein
MRISAGVPALMLETRDLHAYYGESHVLRGVDLRIDRGEVVTLVGRNGAGKTTTLKAIMGMLPGCTGDVVFDSRSISGLSSDKVARCGIGFVPEERGIYATLTVLENLTLPAIVGATDWTVERIFALFPILRERAKAMGTTLSGGEQQMLAIARVLRSGARLILLDEPTEGLAPVIVDTIGDLLLEIKKSGVTVLLVEQNLRFATRVADRHYLMDHGRIVESMSNAAAIEREDELLIHLGV